jgi:alpha-L-rhamnosidase
MTLHAGEHLVVDFGQNCAAVPSFRFNAKEGTTLTCLPAELLNDSLGLKNRGMDGPQGSAHRQNLRIPDSGMRLTYTFAASDSSVSFTPRSTFFGYRYVTITATDDVTIDDILSVPVSSITSNIMTGTITTGDSLINRLITNARY